MQNHSVLETYEWNNVWWEQAGKDSQPRVLYIGDSISCGIRCFATECAENKIWFDGFGTSKALDNPFFKDSIRLFAKQQRYRSLIVFNNGLHGWHLSDDEYRTGYIDMLEFLRNEFPDCAVACVLTTTVQNAPEQYETVLRRNKIACEIADQQNLPVIDLFSVSEQNKELQAGDGVHFTEAGYRILAKTLLENAMEILK